MKSNGLAVCGIIENRTDFSNILFEDLMEEYNGIKSDIDRVKSMNISEKAKKLPMQELQEQRNIVKEKMHDYIDTL